MWELDGLINTVMEPFIVSLVLITAVGNTIVIVIKFHCNRNLLN